MKNNGKTNTLMIIGPANCGKSFFIDCLAAFFINVGYVTNPVKGNQFPYNDCVNRRLLIWNEPSIAPNEYEQVKCLTGGDILSVNVKFQNYQFLEKTPLIVTSNDDIFPNDSTWNTRIVKFRWTEQNWLLKCDKKPHPACIQTLFSLL